MGADKVERPRSGSPKKGRKIKPTESILENERAAAHTTCIRSQIPWTEEETVHVKELLEYLTVQLKAHEDTQQMPHEEMRLLLNTLQQFLFQDELDRNDPLLSKIAYYFQEIKIVDLDKVTRLLKHNQKVGETLRDQKVILLLGNPSSGKTTTLHCLAGTTFKEVVVDGFVHLRPTQYLDAAVAPYETSCGRTSVTKSLQTAKVKVLDEEYVVCDTPVFGCFDSIEEEIVYKNGFEDEITKARSILPVFVLSQECLGNRMSELPEVFEMIMSYFHLQDVNTEVIPFQYVFTRFDDRHRTRLWKMFKYYKETAPSYKGEEDPELFEKVLQDLIDKTNPEANIISPVSDIPRYLLKTLLDDPALESNPRDSMRKAGANHAIKLLHIQLKLTLYGVMMFLANHHFEVAVQRVQDLKELCEILPTAQDYLDLALKACERYAIVLWETYGEHMEKQEYIPALALIEQQIQLSAALPNMDEYIQLSYGDFWTGFAETETKKGKPLITADTVLALRDFAKLNSEVNAELIGGVRCIRAKIQKELPRNDDMGQIVPHFMLLLQMAIGFPEAAKGVSDMLERLEIRIMDRVKEKNYKVAHDDLMAVAELSRNFPEQTKFTSYAVKVYKHTLDHALDKNRFEEAGDVLLQLSSLNEAYNDAGKYATRGLEKLWRKFECAIKQREYATAICVIKHLNKASHVSETAFERSRLGIEVIRDRLFKSIESKNYGMAQVLMQQLTKLERMLPKEMAAKIKKAKKAERGRRGEPSDPEVDRRRRRNKQIPDEEYRRSESPDKHRQKGMSGARKDDYEVEEVKKHERHHHHHRDSYEQKDKMGQKGGTSGARKYYRSAERRGREYDYAEEEARDHEHHHHRSAAEERRYVYEQRDNPGKKGGKFVAVEKDHRGDYEQRDEMESWRHHDGVSDLTMSGPATKLHMQSRYARPPAIQEDRASEPPPPVTKIALNHMKIVTAEERRDPPPRDVAEKEQRDPPPQKSRYSSPPRKSRYESPPQRKSRAHDDQPDYRATTKTRYESPPQRKSRSAKQRQPDSPVLRKSRQAATSRRQHRYESPSKARDRYESPQRRRRHPSRGYDQQQRRTSPPPRRSQNHEAKKWFRGKSNRDHYEEYDAYDEYSAFPTDEEQDEESITSLNNNRRSSSNRHQRHDSRSRSLRSFDTPMEASFYGRERLRYAKKRSDEEETTTSWNI